MATNGKTEVPAEDKELGFIFGKGWSVMNILIGVVLVVGGYAMVGLGILLAITNMGIQWAPAWYNTTPWIGVFMIILGAFGFWFVIPAFQKWWHTKQWLAWVFLGIAVALFLVLVFVLGIF